MATITAQDLLDRNHWTTGDITLAQMEDFIDDAIDYVNLQTDSSISNMTGTPTKSVTVTGKQASLIKALASLLGRAYMDKGPQVGGGMISIGLISTDPNYAVNFTIIKDGMDRLIERSFQRT